MKRILCLLLLWPSVSLAQPVFDRVDTNKDGLVSREELDTERLKRFTLMDTTQNGELDRIELFDAGLDADSVQGFFTMYDLDMDGRIALDEVKSTLEAVDIFTNIDTDQNGTIERTEATGLFDTTPDQAISKQSILQDLQQGVRSRAGFEPLKTPQAQSPDTPGAELAQNPATAVPFTGEILTDSALNRQPPTYTPEGRSGYVARTRNTDAAGLDPWLPNSSPPDGPPFPWRHN